MARMQTCLPGRKVMAGGAAGALTTIAVYLLDSLVLAAPMTAELASALTVLASFAAAYRVPPSELDQVVPGRPPAPLGG
ncbi:hypothetical protein [Poseidonocella sp. HB161398]|uniref:hypothetical protein n=1 Tax=Poseidonocella sp. HB161398 TaxID=2320855 RepID=UPI001109A129|nr:hypothetical protein [Poseidonocella sp. HB161398]